MPAQIALDQGDARAFHRHVGAGAHRDSDVRLRQRGRVVDAVAGHRDHPPLSLQPLDLVGLLVGQHLGADLVDPELACHRFGRGAAVAGQHDDSQPFGLQERASLPASTP